MMTELITCSIFFILGTVHFSSGAVRVFICGLFNNTVNSSGCIASDSRMNWKGYGVKQSRHNLNHYPSICLEGLNKTTKTHSQDRRSVDRDLNLGPPEYEVGMLTTIFSVCVCVCMCVWNIWTGEFPILYFMTETGGMRWEN
jgi:hypothetical protein